MGRGGSASESSSLNTSTSVEDNDYPDLAEVQSAPTSAQPAQYDPLDPTVAAGAEARQGMTAAEILSSRNGKNGNATDSQRMMRIRMVSRSMLRGIDEQTMSEQFKVSLGQIRKDVRYVREQFAKQASELDINDFLGEQMMFFKDVQHTALRIASKSKSTDGAKLAALRTAMTSQADSARLMKLAGVFDALPFTSGKVEEKSDIELMTELTTAIMAMDLEAGEVSDEDQALLDVMQSQSEVEEDDGLDDLRLI